MAAKTQKVAFKSFNASLPNANRTIGFFCSSIYSQGQFEVGSHNGVTPQKWQAQYVLIISTQNVLAYQLICISFELCRATHHCDLTLTEAGEGSLSTRGSPQTSNSEVSCSVAGVPQQAGTARLRGVFLPPMDSCPPSLTLHPRKCPTRGGRRRAEGDQGRKEAL